MLGVISSRRDCCASRRVGSGRSSKCYEGELSGSVLMFVNLGLRTRVDWRTLHKRGKSLTPVSRVVMELSRSCREDCSEVTEDASEEVMVNNW